MRFELSRRQFVGFCSGALALPRWASAQDKRAYNKGSQATEAENREETPPLLDHILLGCGELQGGIQFVQKATGVRAAFGGVHPGRGTQNALLSLGERRYLEIIAPDPKQDVPDELGLRLLEGPALVGWAAHPGGLAEIAQRLKAAGVAFAGPREGSRARPDGRVLSWKTLNLEDNQRHLLPFLIEWSTNSVHPSADAPAGCRLERFVAETPNLESLEKAAEQLGVRMQIEKGDRARLLARIAGPHGLLELSSQLS